MKILFLGTLYKPEDEMDLLKKTTTGLQNQANTFQWALIRGLDHLLDQPMDLLNVLPVGTYPKQYKELFLKSHSWSHKKGAKDREIGSLNLPLVKQATRSVLVKREVEKWLQFNQSDTDLHIIIYSSYQPFLSAVKKLALKANITLIVTDIPEYDDLSMSQNNLKKLLRKWNNKLIYNSLERMDNFVILTEQMKKPLKIDKKPYVVIEGIVDHLLYTEDALSESNKKIALYTGSLTKKLGIMNLVDAFNFIHHEHYEVWICGTGECEDEIVKRAQVDPRIKFFGFVNKQKVLELQQQATILVNTRTNEDEFTKYSFPSKTMEYMMSGRPVIMYKLDGIPNEYDDYLFYFTENSAAHIADKIIEVCEMDAASRDSFGAKAKAFVLDKKNNVVQAEKILKMIKPQH